MDNCTSSESVIPAEKLIVSLSDYLRVVFQVMDYVVLCGIVSLFGIASNIVNILVFVRQGFKDSINISLMGLGISDLCSSITMLWTSICYNPLFYNMDLTIDVLDIMYITAAFPHVCFNRINITSHWVDPYIEFASASIFSTITSFITAFITLERCLCIAMPLKVKNIITPFRTKVIIVIIYLSIIILFSPVFVVNKLEWVYKGSRNKSIYSIVFTDDRELVDSVSFFINSVALSGIFLLSVSISTIILVVKLNEKTKWRSVSVAQAASKQENVSMKDKRVVKMISIISAIFILCYIPPTVNFMIMVFYPEFSYSGKYRNVFHVTWSAAFVMEAVNSSVNIFVYFKMSSKFRTTLFEIFSESPKR